MDRIVSFIDESWIVGCDLDVLLYGVFGFLFLIKFGLFSIGRVGCL